jgi:RNA polymerase sigma-70 factor (ECF subfamily)
MIGDVAIPPAAPVDLSRPEVFAAVYRRHRRPVLNTVWRVVHDRELAEDVTQEVFAWLWSHPHAYDGRASLGTYLAFVARSRAIDAWRTADARLRLDERLRREARAPGRAVQDGTPLAAFIRGDDARQLRALVGQLTQRQREALVLAYWADLPLSALAARLGVPESTAKSRVRLARERLAGPLRALVA